MRLKCQATRYPGVYQVDAKTYRVRAKVTDPRSGMTKEIDRVLEGVDALTASETRVALVRAIKEGTSARAQRVRVRDFARSWLESKARSVDVGSAETYATALTRVSESALGDLYVDSVTGLDVQQWVNSLKLKARSVRSYYQTLRQMLADAVAQLGLDRDPCLRIQLPAIVETRAKITLTADELARVLGVLREEHVEDYALVTTLALTGLRFTHVSGLRWDDVDLDGGILHIRRKHARHRVGPVTRKKSAPSELPLVTELADVLKEHRGRLVAAQHPGVASGWVFPSLRGMPLTQREIMPRWEKALARAKVARVTLHALRHAWIDLSRQAHIDPIVIRAVAGHATESMREHYSKVSLDEKRQAIRCVLRVLPGGKVGTDVGTSDGKTGEVVRDQRVGREAQ